MVEKDKCQLILDIVWQSFHWIAKMQLLDEGRTEPSFLTLPGQKCMMWIAFCQLHVSTYFLWVSGKLIYSNVFLSFLFPYNVLRGNPTFGFS